MKRYAVAGFAITCGFGIEILALDDMKVTWRWSDKETEHVSTIRDGAFRVGRQWYRLSEFQKYEKRRSRA